HDNFPPEYSLGSPNDRISTVRIVGGETVAPVLCQEADGTRRFLGVETTRLPAPAPAPSRRPPLEVVRTVSSVAADSCDDLCTAHRAEPAQPPAHGDPVLRRIHVLKI